MKETDGLRRTLRYLGSGGYDPDRASQVHSARIMRRTERFLHENPSVTLDEIFLAHLAVVTIMLEEKAHQQERKWDVDALTDLLAPHIGGMLMFPQPPRERLELEEKTRELRQ